MIRGHLSIGIGPRQGTAGQYLLDVRTAITLLCRLEAEEKFPTSEVTQAAQRVHALGLRPLASALLHHRSLEPVGPGYIVLARRRLAVSKPVPSVMIRRAYTNATGRRTVPLEVSEPITTGMGWNVEAVVRHRFLGQKFSVIRKTIHGARPVELAADTSGLLDRGDLFRVPHLHHHDSDRPGRWHLFLEDLGRLDRIRRAPDLVVAARALGEMNGRGLDQPDLVQRHPWLKPVGWKLPTFTKLAGGADVLGRELPAELASRQQAAMSRLAELEPLLLRLEKKAPLGLRHGDANTGNVVVRHGKAVVFDLSHFRVEPIGRDLANLLGIPTTIANRQPELVEVCMSAYLDGIGRAGGFPDPDLVAHAYGLQFVRKSLVNMSRFLRQETARRARTGSSGVTLTGPQQQRMAVKVSRVCDEAERLIDRVT